jgi:hypothetical protein
VIPEAVMSKKILHVCAAALIIIAGAWGSESWSADRYNWKIESAVEGFRTYVSEVPGKEYIASKGVGVIPASMEVIGVVIRDIPNYPEWIYNCKATKILKVVDEKADTFIFWYHQHVPLLTDRDMVLRSYVINNYRKGFSVIRANSSSEFNFEGEKGLVRMPAFFSEFLLEWIDRDHTRVTFTIDPDLGEGLPVKASNSIIIKTPYESWLGLMKMVKLQHYIANAKTSKYKKMIDEAIRKRYIK